MKNGVTYMKSVTIPRFKKQMWNIDYINTLRSIQEQIKQRSKFSSINQLGLCSNEEN